MSFVNDNSMRTAGTIDELKGQFPTEKERILRWETMQGMRFISFPPGYLLEPAVYAMAQSGMCLHEVFYSGRSMKLKNAAEVATGKPFCYRFFMDLDAKYLEVPWRSLTGNLRSKEIGRGHGKLVRFIAYLRELLGSRVFVWDASVAKKFSVHIHCPDVGSYKMSVLKALAKSMQDDPRCPMPASLIDLGPYGTKKSLRMPGAPKQDGSRPLLLRKDLSDPLVLPGDPLWNTGMPSDEMFIWGNAEVILEEVDEALLEAAKAFETKREARDDFEPEDEDVERVQEHIRDTLGLSISPGSNGWFRADSADPWDCPVCDSMHDSDNANVLPTSTGYLFFCFSAKRNEVAKTTIHIKT